MIKINKGSTQMRGKLSDLYAEIGCLFANLGDDKDFDKKVLKEMFDLLCMHEGLDKIKALQIDISKLGRRRHHD